VCFARAEQLCITAGVVSKAIEYKAKARALKAEDYAWPPRTGQGHIKKASLGLGLAIKAK